MQLILRSHLVSWLQCTRNSSSSSSSEVSRGQVSSACTLTHSLTHNLTTHHQHHLLLLLALSVNSSPVRSIQQFYITSLSRMAPATPSLLCCFCER